jgi:hypothetical protein
LRSYNGLKKRAHAYCTADKAAQTNGLSPLCVFDDQERSNTMLLVVGILPRLTAALASHQEIAECALDRRWRISRALELYTYVCWLFEFHLVPVNECNSERNANFPTRSRNPGLRASWLCACVLAVFFWVHAQCNGYHVVLSAVCACPNSSIWSHARKPRPVCIAWQYVVEMAARRKWLRYDGRLIPRPLNNVTKALS